MTEITEWEKNKLPKKAMKAKEKPYIINLGR